jgi:hypothetical protein
MRRRSVVFVRSTGRCDATDERLERQVCPLMARTAAGERVGTHDA